MTRLLALVLGAALLSGCGTEFVSDPPRQAPPSAPADAELDAPVADPTEITIPKIGASSSLIPLGLTDHDCPAEPPCLAPPPDDEPEQAGWYAGADPAVAGDEYAPGEFGPAVIAGHVNGIGPDGRKGHPGIFARLHELAPGDEILIDRDGQAQLRFVVTEVQRHPKAAFPSERVYGPTDRPELRLITCGGAFSGGHYVDNVVVYAALG